MAQRTTSSSKYDDYEASEIVARANHQALMAKLQAQNEVDRAADPAKWAEIDCKNIEQASQREAFIVAGRSGAHCAQRLSDVVLIAAERQADFEQLERDAAEDAAL